MTKDMSQKKKKKQIQLGQLHNSACNQKKKENKKYFLQKTKESQLTNKVHTNYSDTVTGDRFKVMREILG